MTANAYRDLKRQIEKNVKQREKDRQIETETIRANVINWDAWLNWRYLRRVARGER